MSALEQDELFPNPIGEQLKAAREAKKLSLAEIANETRIPLRHLQHIEDGAWDALPAITYSIGFARSYANAVGLNGAEIGAQLREQLGVSARPVAQPDYDAPADPTRVPPRSLALIAGAIAVLLMIGYVVWRSGAVDDSAVNQSAIANPAVEAPLPDSATTTAPLGAPATPAADANGPVVLTATADVWLRVNDGPGGPRLYEATLMAGDRFEVPATATQPVILTGRPDALRVTVGSTEIPQLGPAERTIADVSLLPADLLARVGTAPAPPGTGQPLVPAPMPAPAQ